MPMPPATDPQLEYGIGALKEMIQELPTDRPPLREGYRRLRPAPLPARSPARLGPGRPQHTDTQRPRSLPWSQGRERGLAVRAALSAARLA